MRLTRFQRFQAYSVLVALVVGGVGYPLAHAVGHHLHDHAHAAEACSHDHAEEVALSSGSVDDDHHGCAYCPALSPSLSALGASTAACIGGLQVADDSTFLPIVVSVQYSAPPRAPPYQA
ncbi:MAG: DUF2946 family protein [Bacteroidota bacterium]